MFKQLKKELQINIDEKEGLLYLGDKKREMNLLMLRPIDIIEFSEFAGTNADDILTWVGKSIGKIYIDKIFYHKDWTNEPLTIKKEALIEILETLQLCGFGFLYAIFQKDFIKITIINPLSLEEKDNIMARNLCLLYHGILNYIIEGLEIQVEGEEIECVLKGQQNCMFMFNLIGETIPDELIDEDRKPEAVADFLSTL